MIKRLVSNTDISKTKKTIKARTILKLRKGRMQLECSVTCWARYKACSGLPLVVCDASSDLVFRVFSHERYFFLLISFNIKFHNIYLQFSKMIR